MEDENIITAMFELFYEIVATLDQGEISMPSFGTPQRSLIVRFVLPIGGFWG